MGCASYQAKLLPGMKEKIEQRRALFSEAGASREKEAIASSIVKGSILLRERYGGLE